MTDSMKRLERQWMYGRLDDRKRLKLEFVNGVEDFLEFCKRGRDFIFNNEVRCPCGQCQNKRFHQLVDVKNHLISKGFCANYFIWYHHGESTSAADVGSSSRRPSNSYQEMVRDAVGPFDLDEGGSEIEEEPNPRSKLFFDTCPDGCMLFWKEDSMHETCKICGLDRYRMNSHGKRVPRKFLTYLPITPRLQRLYASKSIAEKMRWHAENHRPTGTLAHPSDGEAWKNFNSMYSDFAAEPRNVRLGLCADDFSPYGKFGATYSCWPVIFTPYNLPQWLCMKKQFMFLSLIVLGPKDPKGNLDVYMQPLIEELKQLWDTGALTYDVLKK